VILSSVDEIEVDTRSNCMRLHVKGANNTTDVTVNVIEEFLHLEFGSRLDADAIKKDMSGRANFIKNLESGSIQSGIYCTDPLDILVARLPFLAFVKMYSTTLECRKWSSKYVSRAIYKIRPEGSAVYS